MVRQATEASVAIAWLERYSEERRRLRLVPLPRRATTGSRVSGWGNDDEDWGSGPGGWPPNEEIIAAIAAAAEMARANQATATSVTESGDQSSFTNTDTESAFTT